MNATIETINATIKTTKRAAKAPKVETKTAKTTKLATAAKAMEFFVPALPELKPYKSGANRAAAAAASWCQESTRQNRSKRHLFTAYNPDGSVFMGEVMASQSYENIMNGINMAADDGQVLSSSNVSEKVDLAHGGLNKNIPNRRRRLTSGELDCEVITIIFNGEPRVITVKLVLTK